MIYNRLTKLGITLSILLLFTFSARTQIAYSPFVDSLQQLIDTANLKLIVRQLSGDTTSTINGQDTIITTRRLEHPHNALAAEYIRERFEEYGYTPVTQLFNDNRGENIIVKKSGSTYPNRKYIICAHYDSHCFDSIIAPGADDNASGTAAVLEISRLLYNIQSDYSLEFIAWDEEEPGLWGSEFYAEQAILNGDTIIGVINMDMIGYDSENEGNYMITWDDLSQSFAKLFESTVSQYSPSLNYLRGSSGSDQYSFMQRGYIAIGITEDEENDFNPYYHNYNDVIQNFNLPYYYNLVRTSLSFLLSEILQYKFEVTHEPLQPGRYNTTVETSIVISGQSVALGENSPRLYFSIDSVNYNYLLPVEVVGDTFNYILPVLPDHTSVKYYFAAQNESGELLMTYPSGGLGFSPPGTIPTSSPFFFLADHLSGLTACSDNVPVNLPPFHTTYDTIIITHNLPIFDLDVLIDITHNNVNIFNIELIGPDGTTVRLNESTPGGANYTQTIFDDEADYDIRFGSPPYTGRFKPTESLSVFSKQLMGGMWKLKIAQPNMNNAGKLNEWCLHFVYYDTTTGVRKILAENPLLKQNYPNPVLDYTNIEFTLNKSEFITLYLTDISGKTVKTFLSGKYTSGNHLVVISLKTFKQGIYFYTLITESGKSTRKLIVIRE